MMKRQLLLSLLAAVVGTASAQSSVTMYGTVDVTTRYVKNDGSARLLSEGASGLNSSELGFRGIEDLGDGLRAGFNLAADVIPDTGTTSAKFFNRIAVVRLMGPWGELRLGRDYTPSFWNTSVFGPYGTLGIGGDLNIARFFQGAQPTYVRADNAVGYFLPGSLGGIYGQAMAAAGEGSPGNNGRYIGARLGYAAGPMDVAVAFGRQDANSIRGGYRTDSVGGKYDFGVLRLLGHYNHETLRSTPSAKLTENRYLVGVIVPVGQSEFKASYQRSDLSNSANDAAQFAVGWVYNLSKRTAIYSAVSFIENKGTQNFTVAGGTSMRAPPTGGGKSKGAELGVRHFF